MTLVVFLTLLFCLRMINALSSTCEQISLTQCSAWHDFYDSTGGPSWAKCSGHRDSPCSCKTTEDPYGGYIDCKDADDGIEEYCRQVTCKNESIVGIALNSNGLEGTISPSITLLTDLQFLSLNNNNRLVGPLPGATAMAKLKSLSFLSVNNCGINGTLSDAGVLEIPALEELHMENNRIMGALPEFKQSSIYALDVSGNMIEGKIPESLGTLPHLHQLDLSRNRLTGSIPYSFAQLAKVARQRRGAGQSIFDLSNNALSGAVPDIGWDAWFGYPACDNQPTTDPSICCLLGNNDFICPFPDYAAGCFDDSGLHGGFPTCKNQSLLIV